MEHYGLIAWIIIGGLAGGLAKLVMPGRDPGGCIVTVVLGVVGALVGGFLFRAVGLYGPNEGAGFVAAFVGALILLVLYRIIAGRRRP